MRRPRRIVAMWMKKSRQVLAASAGGRVPSGIGGGNRTQRGMAPADGDGIGHVEAWRQV